jgi:hypothetical protein
VRGWRSARRCARDGLWLPVSPADRSHAGRGRSHGRRAGLARPRESLTALRSGASAGCGPESSRSRTQNSSRHRAHESLDSPPNSSGSFVNRRFIGPAPGFFPPANSDACLPLEETRIGRRVIAEAAYGCHRTRRRADRKLDHHILMPRNTPSLLMGCSDLVLPGNAASRCCDRERREPIEAACQSANNGIAAVGSKCDDIDTGRTAQAVGAVEN